MSGPPLLAPLHREWLDSIDSTSEELKRRAQNGAAEGLIIAAREQSSGRGRQGRVWISPPGNLYASFLLRPQRTAAEAMQVSFVAALAVSDSLLRIAPPTAAVRCKWPNDVLIDGRKVAGILLESALAADRRVDWLIVGIGINLTTHPPAAALRYPATSLQAAGWAVPSPEEILDSIGTDLMRWYERWLQEGFQPVRSAWRQRAAGLGGPIVVQLEHETLAGQFVDLDEIGALILAVGVSRRTITAGDVCLLGAETV